MEFCEYCGNLLNEDDRCPWDGCPHNAILDAMAEAKACLLYTSPSPRD